MAKSERLKQALPQRSRSSGSGSDRSFIGHLLQECDRVQLALHNGRDQQEHRSDVYDGLRYAFLLVTDCLS